MLKQTIFASLSLLSLNLGSASAGELDPSQEKWFPKYQNQKNAPKPDEMLLNTDKEPDLSEGFVNMMTDEGLSEWVIKGGQSIFELNDGVVTGTCVPGEPSSYLCTIRNDYSDFIFSCEIKWEVDHNTGVMIRGTSTDDIAVVGPQIEMEELGKDRGWSGGVYGQDCGGYWYPVWLKEHAEAREAIQPEGWNRLTVLADGTTLKTWVNGVPVANWDGADDYLAGYIGLQIHKAKEGKVQFRNLKIKETKKAPEIVEPVSK